MMKGRGNTLIVWVLGIGLLAGDFMAKYNHEVGIAASVTSS
jgi:hypothetical protein